MELRTRCEKFLATPLQTDGQTDRQTTCDRNTALCTKVHRAVKTVCMVFSPTSRRKIVCKSFLEFKLAGNSLHFVTHFKYLGNTIDNCLLDDADIDKEIKNLFTRAANFY